jgi:hypothetical protein
LLTALALVLATAAAPAAGADPGSDSDAADDPRFAETLAPGVYTGTLGSDADEDYYRLIAPALTKVTVTVDPDCSSSTVDTDVELYEGDGTTLIAADTGGACEAETVACWTNANQQLFTRVFTDSGRPGDYEITHTQTTHTPIAPLDATRLCTVP